MKRLKALMILNSDASRLIYGPDELADLEGCLDFLAPAMTAATVADYTPLLEVADVLFSGWGGPRLDKSFLDLAPNLQALFYGAGTIAELVTDAVWRRNPPLTITTATAVNAIPVTEYTLAAILFSLKHGWRLSREARQRRVVDAFGTHDLPGGYKTTIGLVSLGTIARRLLPFLKQFDLNVLVYDPFLRPSEARELGVTSVSLSEVFRQSDVVSLHTPHLAETEGLITGELLASMKPGATFINTARAAVACQDELVQAAQQRPDLQFVLDVVDPLAPDSPLFTLENVVLTPHIAGSLGNECRRMGRFMVDELHRYLTGQPLKGEVTAESFWHSSHRPPHAPESFNPERTKRQIDQRVAVQTSTSRLRNPIPQRSLI
jgi:phosphoglycerate dehydrogenase-like enzyme